MDAGTLPGLILKTRRRGNISEMLTRPYPATLAELHDMLRYSPGITGRVTVQAPGLALIRRFLIAATILIPVGKFGGRNNVLGYRRLSDDGERQPTGACLRDAPDPFASAHCGPPT
jgi:hypothetical protein